MLSSLVTSPMGNTAKHIHAANVEFNCAHNSPLTIKYKRACFNNYVQPNNQISNSLKKQKIAVDIDTMEPEQIVGIYRVLEKEKVIESVALWSCFFNYNDVVKMQLSDFYDDSLSLKEASNVFAAENRKIDKLCNSPVRSKYLSQNYLDNYLMVEGICKNIKISSQLTSVAFCGLRLSLDSMHVISESLIKNKYLKDLTFNFCLLDNSMLEAIMPALCQNQCLETLNLSCNGLDDKCSYLIAKIVSSQSERRDHVVWSYSLRGELPPNDEYKQGLKQVILSHNNFSDILASELILALRNDLYMRSVDIKNNNIDEQWVGEFVKLMVSNQSLTNLDLRENPGFNLKFHRKLALALLRNIQDLKQKGELELDNTISEESSDSIEFRGKFVKFNVFTVEIPQKFMKKFSAKLMAIKKRRPSTGRNGAKNDFYPRNTSQKKYIQESQDQNYLQNLKLHNPQSRASTSITKATSMQSMSSSKQSGSKQSLNSNKFIQSQEINLQNMISQQRQLEPIGEDSKNESSTSFNILKQKLDQAALQRNSDIIGGNLQIHRRAGNHTQVSSVEIASPAPYQNNQDNEILSINSTDQKVIKFNEEDFLEPLKQKIMEKGLIKVEPCNHCKKCKNLQSHFIEQESKGLQLAIENYKLRKALSSGGNSGDAPSLMYSQNLSSQRQSFSGINTDNEQEILQKMKELMQQYNQLASMLHKKQEQL
eukprot:403345477